MTYSKYPGQIDDEVTLPVTVDRVTPVEAEVVNRLRDSIIATETELGTNPSSTYATVAARLTAIESGGGGVSGSGTDNHIVRWDGTSAVQDSGLIITDGDDLQGVGDIRFNSTETRIDINGGYPTSDDVAGQDIWIQAGDSSTQTGSTQRQGGDVTILGGSGPFGGAIAFKIGDGGDINIGGGYGGFNTNSGDGGNGGDVNIDGGDYGFGGTGADGVYGTVNIGTGAGFRGVTAVNIFANGRSLGDGPVNIGTQDTASVNIGASGVVTYIGDDIEFITGAAHDVYIEKSVADTNGYDLNLTAGEAGAMAGATYRFGGIAKLQGGTGGSASGANTGAKGGRGRVYGGEGGDSTGTAATSGEGGNVEIVGGESPSPSGTGIRGPGGDVWVVGGFGEDGGDVYIRGGFANGAVSGVDGDINIGTAQTVAVNIGHSSSTLGFHGAVAVAKQTIIGAKAGNVALTNLLTALATLGLIVDNTT